jgi:hypothetical protein
MAEKILVFTNRSTTCLSMHFLCRLGVFYFLVKRVWPRPGGRTRTLEIMTFTIWQKILPALQYYRYAFNFSYKCVILTIPLRPRGVLITTSYPALSQRSLISNLKRITVVIMVIISRKLKFSIVNERQPLATIS